MITKIKPADSVTAPRDSGDHPAPSVLASAEKLIACLGHMLGKLTEYAPVIEASQSKFYCKTRPSISLADYLKRIHKFAGCSQYVLLKALIYMDRFQTCREEFVLNGFSVHRQLMCAVMIASKYSQDFYYTNKHYAKVGGIGEEDMMKLEREFLDSLDYHLYVRPEELREYEDKLTAYYELMMGSEVKPGEDEQSSTRPEERS